MIPEVLFELNLDPELPPEIQELAIQQGEDDITKNELIEQFRTLIFQKGKCTPHRMDDEYLMRFLRARFWKAEQSYQLLCNYCDFRGKNRNLYQNVSCQGLMALADDKLLSISPYRDQNGCRILITRSGTWDPTKLSVDDVFRLILIMVEMGSMEPISQVAGGILIFDLEGVSMSHMRYLTPSNAQTIIALMETSTPLRTAAIHIVNQNWFFNGILKLFKQLLSSITERLFIHGSDMGSLHKHVDPKYLPKRYGGVHEDYPIANWWDCLKREAEVRRQLEELGYIVDIVE